MEEITPFTVADHTIKECCRDKEIIEDVIFYLRAYLRREYGSDDITECLDRKIANARQQSLNKLNTYESKDCKYNERQQL